MIRVVALAAICLTVIGDEDVRIFPADEEPEALFQTLGSAGVSADDE
jgi:hypothetical protein